MELTSDQHAAAIDCADLIVGLRRNRKAVEQEERTARLRELAREHKGLAAKAAEVRTRLEDAQKEARTASAEVADAQARAADMEARLNAGEGMTSRDLVALQGDIEKVKAAAERSEESELAALDRAEAAETELAELKKRASAVGKEGNALRAEREDEAHRLEAEKSELQAQLDQRIAQLPDEAASIVREDGVGVLSGGACGACGAALSGVQADTVRNSQRTVAFTCEDCEALILQP